MSVLDLATTKAYLRIDYSDQDAVIQQLIDGAEQWAEEICGVRLAQAARTDDVDGGGFGLWPPAAPVSAVTSVTDIVIDSDTPLDAASYRLAANRIIRVNGWRWAAGPGRFRVDYTGGYAIVPEGLKLSLLKLVARAFANRDGRQAQAVAGFSEKWQSLAGSDVMATLRPYIARPTVG